MEEYITVQEAAEAWGLSIRRIQTLCNENRIEGAKNSELSGPFQRMLQDRKMAE